MHELKVVIDGEEYKVEVEETDSGKLRVYFNGEAFEVETRSDIEKQLSEEIKDDKTGMEKGVIAAPLPAIVFSVDVKEGEKAKKGRKLITLMAMKMENEVCAPVNCIVKEVRVKKGDTVNKGDILVVYKESKESQKNLGRE